MSHCTGPYTRVPFTANDLKPTQVLLQGLAAWKNSMSGASLDVRESPSGQGGTEDFNLHIEIRDTPDHPYLWDVRAAKFIGPKKTFGRSHIYEIAIRKRAAHNAVVWEGYLFARKFETLAKRFPTDLSHIMEGTPVQDLVPAASAQEKRIQLCTGN